MPLHGADGMTGERREQQLIYLQMLEMEMGGRSRGTMHQLISRRRRRRRSFISCCWMERLEHFQERTWDERQKMHIL